MGKDLCISSEATRLHDTRDRDRSRANTSYFSIKDLLGYAEIGEWMPLRVIKRSDLFLGKENDEKFRIVPP
jgi:hypothetical protein